MLTMDAKTIHDIAKRAVESTRAHHGVKVWEYVNPETRKGWVARTIVAEFSFANPDAPARDVAAVVKACDEVVESES